MYKFWKVIAVFLLFGINWGLVYVVSEQINVDWEFCKVTRDLFIYLFANQCKKVHADYVSEGAMYWQSIAILMLWCSIN